MVNDESFSSSSSYIDEFGEVKAVAYESGTKQGFAPRGQHLPVLPRPSKSGGNIGEDDEFGTDEDWNSVDADQDGQPDPPRPKDQRPVVTTKAPRVTPPPQARPAAPPARLERPEPPVFIPAEPAPEPERPAGRPAFVEAAPQQERPAPRPALIPVEEVPRSFRPFQPFQQQQPPPQFQFQRPTAATIPTPSAAVPIPAAATVPRRPRGRATAAVRRAHLLTSVPFHPAGIPSAAQFQSRSFPLPTAAPANHQGVEGPHKNN